MRTNVLITLLLATSFAPACGAGTLEGRVVGVADGDTITVLDADKNQIKVRLAGIDAPEKRQPFGQRSKENLSALVFNKTVALECRKRDRYSRSLCVVFVDRRDINAMQLNAGMAWWYEHYAKEQPLQERRDYELAEHDARLNRRGLWADNNPVPPWEWRHKKRRQ